MASEDGYSTSTYPLKIVPVGFEAEIKPGEIVVRHWDDSFDGSGTFEMPQSCEADPTYYFTQSSSCNYEACPNGAVLGSGYGISGCPPFECGEKILRASINFPRSSVYVYGEGGVSVPTLTLHVRKRLRRVTISCEVREYDDGTRLPYECHVAVKRAKFDRVEDVCGDATSYPKVDTIIDGCAGTDFAAQYGDTIDLRAFFGWECGTEDGGDCCSKLDYVFFDGWYYDTRVSGDRYVKVADSPAWRINLTESQWKYETDVSLTAVFVVKHVKGILTSSDGSIVVSSDGLPLYFDSYLAADRDRECPDRSTNKVT